MQAQNAEPVPLDQLAETANRVYLDRVELTPELRKWASWAELSERGRDTWRNVAREVIRQAQNGARN